MNTEPEITPNFIDLEKLVASKNPRLLKFIPKFVFSYLRRLIHLDAINETVYQYRDEKGLLFVKRVLERLEVKMDAVWLDPDGKLQPMTEDLLRKLLPPESRYIVASNHPLGGLDGMVLLYSIGKVKPDIIAPVNDLLLSLPGMKSLFIPINKHGKNTDNMEIFKQTFASDKTILYFPAGLVSRKQKKGIIRDLDWKKTFITQARKFQRDIYPVFVSGRNSNFFYNLAKFRKRLGIKANFEMILLPDEMFKQKDKTVRLVFGNPIPYTLFDHSRSDAEWAEYVKNVVYDIGEKARKQFNSLPPR
ncbi:MAG: glycerol acyltransferase [Bacteroidota bacterium]|nr:glycerol acyltransferase [Bacteroidota bacterium]